MNDGPPDTTAEETRRVNEQLVIAGVRMQELMEEVEAARRRLTVIAVAGRLLGTSLDIAAVFPAFAELLVGDLCDCCCLEATRESGVSLCSICAPDAAACEIKPVVERARWLSLSRGGTVSCATTPDAGAGDPGLAALLRDTGFTAVVSAPFEAQAQARGALTLFSRRRAIEPADVTLTEELAERVGLAVYRASLHQAALDAVRSRDDLLAVVSHDLRNPLNTIVLSSALLSRSAAATAEGASQHVARIQRSAGHMQRLLQDLIDSAKIGAGHFVVDRRPEALAPVVTEVREMLAPLAESRSVRLGVTIDDALRRLPVWIDPERVQRMLTNLVGNAVKFTPTEGSVTLDAALVGDEVRLSVHDTGPGIPEEDVAHLFDRFWQARQTAALGAGLGLFIAREIALAHGGRIWVESELGAGSTFVVALPLAAP